jgi:hypothetical protein
MVGSNIEGLAGRLETSKAYNHGKQRYFGPGMEMETEKTFNWFGMNPNGYFVTFKPTLNWVCKMQARRVTLCFVALSESVLEDHGARRTLEVHRSI